MISTIRADFYRLFRTKGFWISQLLLIAFIFASIAGQTVGQVGVNLEDTAGTASDAFAMDWTGVISVNAMTSMMQLFVYFMLPLLVIIIGHDFTKETYKNILTVGVSRTKYFLSQYLSFAFMILLQVFYIYMVSFLTGMLFYGVGEGFNTNQIREWLFTGMIQFITIMAIMTISCFVTYLTRSNVLSIIIAVAFPFIPVLLTLIFPNTEWLRFFDFQSIISNPAFIINNAKETSQVTITALLTIAILLTATTHQFKKMDL